MLAEQGLSDYLMAETTAENANVLMVKVNILKPQVSIPQLQRSDRKSFHSSSLPPT